MQTIHFKIYMPLKMGLGKKRYPHGQQAHFDPSPDSMYADQLLPLKCNSFCQILPQ